MKWRSFIIQVQWDRAGLPSTVGPFATQREAEQWGKRNIPNGTWNVAPLAWPHSVASGYVPEFRLSVSEVTA